MSCCLNTSLIMNHFMQKKNTINLWLKRRFNQNSSTKLNDKEVIKLEESKYIKKIGCKIPKNSIEENLENDHFNGDKQDEKVIKHHKSVASEPNSKDRSKGNPNDDWELFFVVDKLNPKLDQLNEKNDEKVKCSNEDKRFEIDKLDLEWNNSDLEWDELTFHDEQDQLINQK